MSETRFYVECRHGLNYGDADKWVVLDRNKEREPQDARGPASAARLCNRLNADWYRYQVAMSDPAQSKPTA